MKNGDLFRGSVYKRGGTTSDKWNNTFKTNKTFRDANTGAIFDSKGKFLGIEENHKHSYGYDPKKSSSKFVSEKQRKHVMSLIRRGR